MKRRDPANRNRGLTYPEVGDRVLLRGPKLSKNVAGHGPGVRPARGTFRIVEAIGGRTTLEDTATGEKLTDQHADNFIYLPEDVQDYENAPLQLDIEAPNESLVRESIGQMLDKRHQAKPKPAPRDRRRKLAGLHVGRMPAYEGEVLNLLRLGRVVNFSVAEGSATLHHYWPRVDAALRVRWPPAFARPPEGNDGEVAQEGEPLRETVEISRILTVVDLRDGVMNHASARKLDRANLKVDEGVI